MYLIRVSQLELPPISCPVYTWLAAAVCEELQQKLPQLNGTTSYIDIVEEILEGHLQRTQMYVSHTNFIYHLLQTLPTCVTSKNSCWYHCSVQITVVAYIFSEAPVWMWESEDSFKHGLLCHRVWILEWSSPWQRCHSVATVGNLYMRVCLYKYRIVKIQKKWRSIRATVSGDVLNIFRQPYWITGYAGLVKYDLFHSSHFTKK